MDLSVVEDQQDERIAKALMELMEKGNEGFGRAAGCSFPVHLLCAQMKGSKECRALALGWTRDFALFALATPAPLYIGLIAPVGFSAKRTSTRRACLSSWTVSTIGATRFFFVPHWEPCEAGSGLGGYKPSRLLSSDDAPWPH